MKIGMKHCCGEQESRRVVRGGHAGVEVGWTLSIWMTKFSRASTQWGFERIGELSNVEGVYSCVVWVGIGTGQVLRRMYPKVMPPAHGMPKCRGLKCLLETRHPHAVLFGSSENSCGSYRPAVVLKGSLKRPRAWPFITSAHASVRGHITQTYTRLSVPLKIRSFLPPCLRYFCSSPPEPSAPQCNLGDLY